MLRNQLIQLNDRLDEQLINRAMRIHNLDRPTAQKLVDEQVKKEVESNLLIQ